MLSNQQHDHSIGIGIIREPREIIYYDPDQYSTKIAMIHKDGSIIPLYHGDSLMYVSGRRGSGKSTFCSNYANMYAQNTGNRVFLISRLEYDESFQLPARGYRLTLSNLDDITLPEMANSLIIFDDITDGKLSRKETLKINSFISDVIENSRHYNISAIITSHMPSNYQKTRSILSECNFFVIFPQFSNVHQNERVLKEYFGLSDDTIDSILSEQKSRWVMISTINPKYIMTEHSVRTYN